MRNGSFLSTLHFAQSVKTLTGLEMKLRLSFSAGDELSSRLCEKNCYLHLENSNFFLIMRLCFGRELLFVGIYLCFRYFVRYFDFSDSNEQIFIVISSVG